MGAAGDDDSEDPFAAAAAGGDLFATSAPGGANLFADDPFADDPFKDPFAHPSSSLPRDAPTANARGNAAKGEPAEGRRAPAEEVRLYSDEHAGLFVSNKRPPKVLKLLERVPHYLLLENDIGELSVLIPSTHAIRPEVESEMFATAVVFQRGNSAWLAAAGDTRHYLYPVHLSQHFLFTPTLASRLYLLLLYFQARRYRDVFDLAPICVADTALSLEERHIFKQLATLRLDLSPDAHACRLKIALATAAARATMPTHTLWSLGAELSAYVVKFQAVSQ
jgi:hypothetical protein